MKSVRVFYTKTDRMRFVSHLDMTRFMSRMLRKANIPVWYTEGFHPHLYVTFALPLSLGFESSYEIMDIRVTNDNYSLDEIKERLNAVFPPYVRVFKVAEPILKTGKVAGARFEIFFDKTDVISPLKEFLSRKSIICTKTTKKGGVKEIDLVPKIREKGIESTENSVKLSLLLPAGGEDNLNPSLILDAFFEAYPEAFSSYKIYRTEILDSDGKLFC